MYEIKGHHHISMVTKNANKNNHFYKNVLENPDSISKVVLKKGLDAGTFEYKGRRDLEASNLGKEELLAKLIG